MLQDLRYALRSMRKNPGLTAAVALSIGLGVGANAAMYSIVHSVLLAPLEFRDSGKLVELWEHPSGTVNDRSQMSGPDFIDFRDQNTSFEHVAAVIPAFTFPLSGLGEPMLAHLAAFSPEFFDVFGVKPILGKVYEPADYHEGTNTILISYSFWQRQYGGDPNVVGKKFFLNRALVVVIGVMPPMHDLFGNVDLFSTYIPDYEWARQRGNKFLDIVGRLKPGVTVAQAQQELQAIYRRMPGVQPAATLEAAPVKEQIVGEARPALLVLMGAVALVLLVTCANVANLLLARGAARQKEIATRFALGASRGRIARQFVTESVVLSLAGGAVGVLLSYWLVQVLVRLNPLFLPRVSEIRVDGTVLLFGLAVSLAAGIVFGLAPAMAASRTALNERPRWGRGEANGGGPQWGRGVLVAAELGMAVMLLIGAGLLARSFWRLMEVQPGFRPDHLLTLGLRPTDDLIRSTFYPELLERLGARPAVDAAAVSDCTPFGHVSSADIVAAECIADRNRMPSADACFISPAYFGALGIPLLRGRVFDRRDGASSTPVAVVSAALAQELWPGEDPIGRRLAANYRSLGRATEEAPVEREVVGVVGEVHLRGLETPSRMAVYLPYQQDETGRSLRSMALYVRSKSDPEKMSRSIQSDVRSVGPDVPVLNVKTMEAVMSQSLAPRTFTMAVLGCFAGLALLLAAAGLYGVVAYSVARRTREIGIRMALGASKPDVLGLVVGRELRWLGLGLIAGLAGAVALSRLMGGLLFGVGSTDVVTYAGVVGLLAIVALVACFMPARKAARIDVVVALREE
jgi:putative ABC transport system permease protein